MPFDGVCYKDESPLSVLLVTKSSLSMQSHFGEQRKQ